MTLHLARCLFVLCLGLAMGGLNDVASAQQVPPADVDDAAFAVWLTEQRDGIAQQRTAAQQRYDEQEFACWRRFAVNDCLRAARLQRRQVLDRLRQQDLRLNDAERERRTRKRLRAIGEKQGGG